jgi:hypothetical protein
MAKLADRVKETTASTGTGALSLAGAVAGFRAFADALDNGDMVPYVIEAANGVDWETGLGTFATGSPSTLTRSTVTASSNAGAALDLPAGPHVVFLGMISRVARAIDYVSPVNISGAAALTAAAAIGRHHVCTGTTADYEVDLPLTGLSPGDLVSVEMSSDLTKLVTVDAGAGGQTIDGERYRVMWAGESAALKWSGTNWQKISGRSRPMTFKASPNGDQSTLTSATWVPVLMSGVEHYDTGGVIDNNLFKPRRAGRWALQGMAVGGSSNSITRQVHRLTKAAIAVAHFGSIAGISATGVYLYIGGALTLDVVSGDQLAFEIYGQVSSGTWNIIGTVGGTVYTFLAGIEQIDW